jgi:hypothetical protein
MVRGEKVATGYENNAGATILSKQAIEQDRSGQPELPPEPFPQRRYAEYGLF